jgi:hypothetical protein
MHIELYSGNLNLTVHLIDPGVDGKKYGVKMWGRNDTDAMEECYKHGNNPSFFTRHYVIEGHEKLSPPNTSFSMYFRILAPDLSIHYLTDIPYYHT